MNSKGKNTNLYVFTDDESYIHEYVNLKVVYIKNYNKLIWDYLLLPLSARRYELYSIVYTKNVIPFTHLFFSWKKISVAHDLGYFYKVLNAYKFWDTLYMTLAMRFSFVYADKIITVSNFTKQEIIKLFKIPEEKIVVNYHGVSTIYQTITDTNRLLHVRSRYNLQLPFIFYVGSLSPRKNILRALSAFNAIKSKIPHHFYLISSSSWNAEDIYVYIDKHLSDRVRIIENVSDNDLVMFYNQADALIYLSLYEGFGMPVLEALASGCPVLASENTPCMEIIEPNSHLIPVNPLDLIEIKKGINDIVKVRNTKSHKSSGIISGVRYSWKTTARNLIKIASYA